MVKDNTPLPATLHAWRAPAETDPDAYPLELLTNILATGRSSRLYKRLVEKEQAAMDVEAFPYCWKRPAWSASSPPARMGSSCDARPAHHRGSRVMKKDGVTEEEFQKALNQKEAEFANAFGTMHARAKISPAITSSTATRI